MRARHWTWLGLLILGGLGLLGYHAATTSLGITTGTSRNEVFYRFTASYKVDKTEKNSIDIVVGCSVELTSFKSGDTSVRVSYSPSHFPVRTKNNHVILVQIPNRCYEVRQNYADLSHDVLPYVQWIESADDLLLGIGYMTEDAYESPLSRLTFEGVSLAKATHAEWQAWRAKAAEGFVPTEAILEPWGFDDRELNLRAPFTKHRFARSCAAMARFITPESVKTWLQSVWPTHNERYWYPDSFGGSRSEILQRLESHNGYLHEYNGFPLPYYRRQMADHKGIPLRRMGAAVREAYPVRRSYHGKTWPELAAFDPTSVWQLDFQPQTLGFAYCDGRRVKPELKGDDIGAFREYIKSFPAIALINDAHIYSNKTNENKRNEPSGDFQSSMFDPLEIVLDRDSQFFLNADTFF